MFEGDKDADPLPDTNSIRSWFCYLAVGPPAHLRPGKATAALTLLFDFCRRNHRDFYRHLSCPLRLFLGST